MYLKKSVSDLEPSITFSRAPGFDGGHKDSRMTTQIISIAASPDVKSKTYRREDNKTQGLKNTKKSQPFTYKVSLLFTVSGKTVNYPKLL